MGEVTNYPHGTFCWIDLGTVDLPGAKAFYGALLGWQFRDLPGDDTDTYTLCVLGGRNVCGMHRHGQDEGSGWASSISVDDTDQATATARSLDATVVAEPFDLAGVARMAVLADPAGAVVSLWQPAGFSGAGVVNEVGAWTWNELLAPDLATAKAFYGGLFAWTAQDAPGPIQRLGWSRDEDGVLVGGAHVPTPPEQSRSPAWTVSFRVADTDQAAAAVQQLGGSVLLPPMGVPTGRFAIVTDPAGAAFTITAGSTVRGLDSP